MEGKWHREHGYQIQDLIAGMIRLALKYFHPIQVYTRAYSMEKEEDALRKERERLESANNREVVNLNLKPHDLALMPLNQRLSH